MENRIENIISILDEKKATDIVKYDLSQKDYIASNVIIATSLNSKHAMSLVDILKDSLKPLGEEFLAVDSSDDWIVIDLGDLFIHILSDTFRKKYNLEEFLSTFKG